MMKRTTVDILTGFLGSGKTTLLNGLLNSGGFANTAVVVNELGDVAIDHLLIDQVSDQIALLEGGCLCCAVVDSLPETLLELCRKRASGEVGSFDRIVIETTGLADPAPIAEVVRRSPLLSHFLEAGQIITAFDSLYGPAQLHHHPEVLRQLILADRILLTKCDLSDGDGAERDGVFKLAASLNPLAEILTSQAVLAEPSLLTQAAQGPRPTLPQSSPAHHSHGVRAHGFAIPAQATRAGLGAFAAALSLHLGGSLLRCKGLLRTLDSVILLQGVGPRFEFSRAPERAASADFGITIITQNQARETLIPLLDWLHVPEGTQPPICKDQLP